MRKKLKILYHHRIAAQDGQSVHIQELTAAFKRLGHELIFVGPSLRPAAFGESSGLLKWVRRLLPQAAQELLEIAYGHRAYKKLLAAYEQHKPDILYERHNLFLTAGKKLKKKTGIPYLLEVNAPLTDERAEHSGLFFQKIACKMEEAVWCAADMAFPVTNVLAGKLHQAGVTRANVTVIHNGINHNDYADLDQTKIRSKYGLKGKIVLGFTGFLREWHRLDHIIKMIAEFDIATSPHLLVVGEGPAIEDCKRLASSLMISERVHFAGFRTRKEIPEYLAAMDIALQPAVTDYASPLKMFEYMESELAIIAPNVPNIREILDDGHSALLFDAVDLSQADAAIKRLIDDPKLRSKLGGAAKAAITERGFTWEDNAERIISIAEQLISQRGTP